jgi:hypothetical protein
MASGPSINVVGNNVVGNASRTQVFSSDIAGAGPNLNPAIALSNQGNLVLLDFWGENGSNATPMYNLTSSGNLFVASGTFSTNMNTNGAMETLNGFSGTVTAGEHVLNSGAGDQGNITISSPTNINAFYFGMVPCMLNSESYWNVAAGGNVALANSFIANSAAGATCNSSPVSFANQSSMTNAQILAQFAQERAAIPQADTTLPSGISDVQLDFVQVENAAPGISVVPGA